MKKGSKSVVARSAGQLASALRLSPADAVEIEVRSTLNDKIIEIVTKQGLTHAEVAKVGETSRTRMTAILNRNTHDVSTDLMLRILARLGYRVTMKFSKAA